MHMSEELPSKYGLDQYTEFYLPSYWLTRLFSPGS